MGIAALVLGIVSVLIILIPFCGAVGILPSAVGLVLGIIEIVKKNKQKKQKGMAIAGTVLCSIGVIIAIIWEILIFDQIEGFSKMFP